MERPPVPDDLARFILLNIPSVPYLEALLLMRAETSQPWDAPRLAQRLYVGEKAAHELLVTLTNNDVIENAGSDRTLYTYRPQSAALGEMVDRLADAYSQNLIGVTVLIHSKSKKAAQQFADAFTWRKVP